MTVVSTDPPHGYVRVHASWARGRGVDVATLIDLNANPQHIGSVVSIHHTREGRFEFSLPPGFYRLVVERDPERPGTFEKPVIDVDFPIEPKFARGKFWIDEVGRPPKGDQLAWHWTAPPLVGPRPVRLVAVPDHNDNEDIPPSGDIPTFSLSLNQPQPFPWAAVSAIGGLAVALVAVATYMNKRHR